VVRRALSGDTDILLVAPERLLVSRFRALLHRLPVALLAVDEAHCISQWGHDFRPAYLRIGEVRRRLRVPVLALTATATPRVRREIETSLGLADPTRVVGSFDRPNLGWSVFRSRGHGEKMRIVRRLLRGREGATILYASTRRSVEAVRRALAGRGILAMAYHAGLSPVRRSEVQGRFLEDPAPVVAATNAFGMGIDRPDVRLVIHYQLSGSLEAYYQEAGRAGRDGDPAACAALWGPGDRNIHDAFAALAHPDARTLRAVLRWSARSLRPGVAEDVDPARVARYLGLGGGEEQAAACFQALARAGALTADGEKVTLLNPEASLAPLAELREISRAQVDAVEEYAREKRCRRRHLLSYFGEVVEDGRCGRCDRCRAAAAAGVSGAVRRFTALFARPGSL
jgi:ATP-dependent DNA helicase RecQ